MGGIDTSQACAVVSQRLTSAQSPLCVLFQNVTVSTSLHKTFLWRDLYRWRSVGFICTHSTTRSLLQGNSRSAKASSRPFKAEAVLESLERLLIQRRQFNGYLWPSFRDPCQMCLRGLKIVLQARQRLHNFFRTLSKGKLV